MNDQFWAFQMVHINPFLPSIAFWSPWKHQNTFGFLMFSGGSKGNIGEKKGYEIQHCGGSYSDCSRTQWLILFHICYVCYCFCFLLIINNSRINGVLPLKGSHQRCSIKKEIRKICWKALVSEFFKLSSFTG